MATATTPASASSYRINMAATNPTYLEEEMPLGRLMGDAVLMPDGTVGIFNGAQTGVHSLPSNRRSVSGLHSSVSIRGLPLSPFTCSCYLHLQALLCLPTAGPAPVAHLRTPDHVTL